MSDMFTFHVRVRVRVGVRITHTHYRDPTYVDVKSVSFMSVMTPLRGAMWFGNAFRTTVSAVR